MYSLKLDESGRILYATLPEYAPADYPVVDELPEGDVLDYLYIDGEYVYDPLPEPEAEPTTDDVVNALLGVTE